MKLLIQVGLGEKEEEEDDEEEDDDFEARLRNPDSRRGAREAGLGRWGEIDGRHGGASLRRRVYASVSTQAYIGTIRRRRGLRRWRRAYHVKWEGRGSLRSEPGRARFVLALATKRPQHPDTFSQHMAFQRPILMIKVWSSSLTDPWRVHGVLLETFFVPRHHRPHDGTIFSLS